jgi:hypothetical protein
MSTSTNQSSLPRRFTNQQKRLAVTKRHDIPVSSLTKWVRQARIDRDELGDPGQDLLTSEERSELQKLRQENRELSREKVFSGGWQRTLLGTAAADRLRLNIQLAGVAWPCQRPGVGHRDYYDWRHRKEPGTRAEGNAMFTAAI